MRILMIFFLKTFGFFLGGIFRSLFPRKAHRSNYSALSNVDKVKLLEKRRQYKGYRKEWLFYRCKEEGLLKEYNQLFTPEVRKLDEKSHNGNPIVKFSFGKYKGEPVNDVWNYDRGYIKWAYENADLSQYPYEESAIGRLIDAPYKMAALT